MAANIKVQSDAKSFQDEMKKVTQNLKLMSSELGVVTTKASLFGSEQDKLKAKSNELSNSIKGQNTILGLHKQSITALTGDINKYKERNTELSKSIADVEKKLKDEIKANGENSVEAKKLTSELNKLQNEFKANEKAIDKSSKQVDTYKIKMNEAEKSILETKKALEDTDKKLNTMGWEKASKGLTDFGNKTKEIGQDLTTKVTLPIVGAGVGAVKFATDMQENINKVDTIFGKNAEEVKKWSDSTLDKFGIANVTALDMAATFGDMGTSMGIPLDEASKMSMSLVGLSGDLASFKNIKIDVAKTALNGIYSGETESLKQLGVVMTQAALQEYAHGKGINKKIQDMSESEKVSLRYQFVMDKLKNSQGDFNKTSEGTANQTRIFSENLKQIGVTFGQQLLPAINPVLQGINDFLKSITKMSPEGQKIVIGIGLILAVLPPLLVIIGTLIISIGAITGAIAAAGGVMAVLTSPITLVIAAIVGLIAIGVALWANWDTIKVKAGELGASISNKFNSIKESIMNSIRTAIDYVGNQINKVKGFFANLKFELPKFKLPHFSLTGSFSLNPPSIPKLGVEWYAKGGIMTKPTMFGMNGVNAMVGGEAGAEGIIPLKELWNQLGKNFDKLEQRLSNKEQKSNDNRPVYLVMDNKVVARILADDIDEISAQKNSDRIRLGYGGV